jgi:hypothetical protein
MLTNFAERVSVLLKEAIALIHDLTSIVFDAEQCVLDTGANVEGTGTCTHEHEQIDEEC